MKYKIYVFISMFLSCLSWIIKINPYIQTSHFVSMLTELITFSAWVSTALFFYFALKKTFETAKTSNELALLEKQQEMRSQQETTLCKLQEKNLRSMKASIKQLSYLQNLLDTGEYKKAENYIRQISQQFDRTKSTPVCNDSLIDFILQQKREYAQLNGICVEYQLFFPSDMEEIQADLSGLFFNLLDNGIEACLDSGAPAPILSLLVKSHAGFLHIKMINSKSPDTVFTHATTKKDVLSHGFGLSIIEDIVKKYDGNYQWLDHSGTFESRLMLRYQ